MDKRITLGLLRDFANKFADKVESLFVKKTQGLVNAMPKDSNTITFTRGDGTPFDVSISGGGSTNAETADFAYRAETADFAKTLATLDEQNGSPGYYMNGPNGIITEYCSARNLGLEGYGGIMDSGMLQLNTFIPYGYFNGGTPSQIVTGSEGNMFYRTAKDMNTWMPWVRMGIAPEVNYLKFSTHYNDVTAGDFDKRYFINTPGWYRFYKVFADDCVIINLSRSYSILDNEAYMLSVCFKYRKCTVTQLAGICEFQFIEKLRFIYIGSYYYIDFYTIDNRGNFYFPNGMGRGEFLIPYLVDDTSEGETIMKEFTLTRGGMVSDGDVKATASDGTVVSLLQLAGKS